MRKIKWVLVAALLLLLLAGCDRIVQVQVVTEADLTATSAGVSPTALVTATTGVLSPTAALTTATTAAVTPATETPASPTTTAPAPTATATTAPATATTAPPTPTATRPPATATPSAQRIRFQAGATSGVVFGHLEGSAADTYVLGAQAGQLMEVSLYAKLPINLAIRGVDGTVLKQSTDGLRDWQGKLPSTQDYIIQVSSAGTTVDYGLRVTAYARIQFPAGQTQATITGPIDRVGPEGVEFAGGYVLRAFGGQLMEVALSSPTGDVLLDVVGADGIPLKRYQVGDPSMKGVLPTTQDYYLRPVSAGGPTRFTMTVRIYPLSLPEPVRIQFRPGATSAQVEDRLQPGTYARYVLQALRGQRMVVSVLPAELLSISVEGPGGAFWSQPGPGEPVTIAALPATGDYTITLAVPYSSEPVDYVLDVAIR